MRNYVGKVPTLVKYRYHSGIFCFTKLCVVVKCRYINFSKNQETVRDK
jgi:hypothetical protein